MTAIAARADARALPLSDASVDLIVTSPPYWSLRSYADAGQHYTAQIGSEPTPAQYIAALVGCTREWCRVLKPGGSLFVNLGDKYATRWSSRSEGSGFRSDRDRQGRGGRNRTGVREKSLLGLPWRYALACIGGGPALGDPAVVRQLLRDVALGVLTLAQAEEMVGDLAEVTGPGLGLILRAEVIWSKTNPLPDSAPDRVGRAHEQLFHFTKGPRYYSAADMVREPTTDRAGAMSWEQRRAGGEPVRQGEQRRGFGAGMTGNPLGKAPGSVWALASQPLPGKRLGLAHTAAFPAALVRPAVLGWSPRSVCSACGEGRRPVVLRPGRTGDNNPYSRDGSRARSYMDGGQQRWAERQTHPDRIAGEACACTPYTDHPERRRPTVTPNGQGDGFARDQHARALASGSATHMIGWPEREPVREYHLDRWVPPPSSPGVVVDPFGGTGTTAMVADVLGRHGISFDYSAEYTAGARVRMADTLQRAIAADVDPPPARLIPTKDQEALF